MIEKTIYVDEVCQDDCTDRTAVTIGDEGLRIRYEYSKDGGQTWRVWQDIGAGMSLKGLVAILGAVKEALAVYGEEAEGDV